MFFIAKTVGSFRKNTYFCQSHPAVVARASRLCSFAASTFCLLHFSFYLSARLHYTCPETPCPVKLSFYDKQSAVTLVDGRQKSKATPSRTAFL
jgi:hypothetical protein